MSTKSVNNNESAGLRQCLGRFATGVTVVTCADARGGPCGITANSFSSVSLEPPLVLWNIAKVSNSLQAYLGAKHFAFNILGEDQQDISDHFARTDHTRFSGIEYSLSADGVPLLGGAIAVLECHTHEIHDCGDHYIIIGEVLRFESRDGEPLIFANGGYTALR